MTSTLTYRKLLSAFLLSAASTSVNAMTLPEYLEQVKTQSSGYKAQEALSSSAKLKGREADLVFSPSLFAEGRTGYDAKLSSPPSLVFDKLESSNYKLGVSQQFSMGLQAKVYYDVSRTNFAGANFGPNVATKYWDASPKLELNLPILGGGFGRTAVANQELIRQQSLAESFTASNQANNFLIGAEAAYWKLSAWNDVVRIQEQALKAAQNILNYVTKKQNMNLGERSDVIQARALVEGRTLELQIAKNEARDSLRNFNKLRNAPADLAADSLQPVDVKTLENLVAPAARPGDRADVKATEAQLNSAKASSRLATERNTTTFDVYGTYALNGRDDDLNRALENVGESKRDSAFVGFRMNMPLNFAASTDARASALQAEKAAELNREYSTYAQDMDWATLIQDLTDGRENLKMLSRIEEVQKTKLENERVRLRQGRTTTYQVLLFEQDYTQAAVTRVKSAANILSLQAQIKLYETENSLEGGK